MKKLRLFLCFTLAFLLAGANVDAQLPDDTCAVKYWSPQLVSHSAFANSAIWVNDSTLFTSFQETAQTLDQSDSLSYTAIGVRIQDAYGNLVAQKEYRNFGWHLSCGGPNAIVRTQDGNIVMAGNRMDTTLSTSDGLLIKFTPKGDTLWTRLIGTFYQTSLFGIDELENGDLVIAGSRWDGSTDTDVFLGVCDPQGVLRWQKGLGTPSLDAATDVVANPSGDGFLIAGYTTAGNVDPGATSRYLLYTDTLGIEIWEKKLGEIEGWGREWLESVKLLRDELPVITGIGVTDSTGISHPYIAKLNWSGSIIWERSIIGYDSAGFPAMGILKDFAEAPDGSIFAAGALFTSSASCLGLVSHITPDGDMVWYRTFSPSPYYENAIMRILPRKDQPGYFTYGIGHPGDVAKFSLWHMWLDPQGKLDTCNHVGTTPPQNPNDLFIYPNPADDQLIVQLPQGSSNIEISMWNMQGQQVMVKQVSGGHKLAVFEIPDIPAGMYICRAVLPDGKAWQTRVSVIH